MDLEIHAYFIEGCQLRAYQHDGMFQLGLGSARNFLNTFVLAQKMGVVLHYEALEWEPIPPEFVADIPNSNIGKQAVQKVLQDVRKDHQRSEVTFGERGHRLVLHPFSYEQTLLPRHFFHALFHDPFAMRVNEESWSVDYFRWAYGVLQKDGILATYSSAGQVRRIWQRQVLCWCYQWTW